MLFPASKTALPMQIPGYAPVFEDILEAKNVLEDSTSGYNTLYHFSVISVLCEDQ